MNLSNNRIGDEGSKALAMALEKNTTLQNLNLNYNRLGDEGVKAIAPFRNRILLLNFALAARTH